MWFATQIPLLLADCPAGTLTRMGIAACTTGARLLCLCVAGAIRLRTTNVTFCRRAVRGWLIATGGCVLVCAVLPAATRLKSGLSMLFPRTGQGGHGFLHPQKCQHRPASI